MHIFLLILLFMLMMVDIIMLAKIINCYNNRAKIVEAIYRYNIAEINKYNFSNRLKYNSVMEPDAKTLSRWWDWGCRHIVDEATYELIKPYLEEENR